MRSLAIVFVVLWTGGAHAAPDRFVTASDAILCLAPGRLNEASQPEIAQSQQRLRRLQCMRIGSGIPLTVIERTHPSVWKVSLRPDGIPDGVTLWGRVSSFTTPDGEPLVHSTRAERR